MGMKACRLVCFLWLAGVAGAAGALKGSAFYVAHWNVENLFDTQDDPRNRGDDEFLPNNPTTRWTRVRYEAKLDNLAEVISGMNRKRGPDILGMCEVENKQVVRDLVARLPGRSYGIVHEESRDGRGIDTALIFDQKLFSLAGSRTYSVNLRWRRRTRDILHATLVDAAGRKLHVLVNHWPSRSGGIDETEGDRVVAARMLLRAVGWIFRDDSSARIVVLGDFNDDPTNRSVRDVLGAEVYPSPSGRYVDKRLYNLSLLPFKGGDGSFFHAFGGKVNWRMYDQIIVSGTLLQRSGGESDVAEFHVVRPACMTVARGWNKGAPLPTFEDQEFYKGGYSDHFPVAAKIFVSDAKPALVPALPRVKPKVKVEPVPPPPAPRVKPRVKVESVPRPKVPESEEPVVW